MYMNETGGTGYAQYIPLIQCVLSINYTFVLTTVVADP